MWMSIKISLKFVAKGTIKNKTPVKRQAIIWTNGDSLTDVTRP